MRRMAERGATVILGVGFGQADAIATVSAEFPKHNSQSSTSVAIR